MEKVGRYNALSAAGHHLVLDELPPHSTPTDFLRGARLLLRALALIGRAPRLRVLTLLCAVVTAFALFIVAIGSAYAGPPLAALIISGEETWRPLARAVLTGVLFVVLFSLGALTAPSLLLSPLQDPLAEATETALGDFEAEPFSARGLVGGMVLAIRHSVLRLVLMVAGYVLLLPLNLIPATGSIAYLALATPWAIFWLAAEHLSNNLTRHQRPFSDVPRALWRRLWLSMGCGSGLYLLAWVPVFNVLLLPVAVVSGTLLYRTLRKAGALPEQT